MTKETSDRVGIFIFGFIVGCVFLSSLSRWYDGSMYNTYNKALTECEKNLPRDQVCKITAVPDIKKPDSK